MPHNFFRKPLFWITATVLALALGIGAYCLFPITFPLVSIDLKMDRAGALTEAASLAKHQDIGPKEYSEATTFASDNKAKIFIELEGGGDKKFNEIIKASYFAPYYWQVRHFNPCLKHEATFYFMPNGQPYGFEELIAEDKKLPNLSKEEALILAERVASTTWHIDFKIHKLVEQSTDEKPNGRIDHMLVYERTDEKIDHAPYRVSITVTGNKVTSVKKSIKIPQAFERRYAHMRSANNLIASWASTLMFILYLLLGCVLGLVLLVRYNRDWLLWRAPLFWASFLALGIFLEHLNSYPLWWVRYHTADSSFSFIAGMIQAILLSCGSHFLIFFITFLAAESLTRKAFPKQIQLWSLAKPEVASSWQVLGRTIGGYLMIGFDFIFVTLFYFISLRYFGWWSPADTLIDPNILATYVPWFSPFLNALRAGFWEECLFRAVPLSCFMLIARRYGNKYWWMTLGMIVQALIFAGAHANYPAQPAYARLVELIIPSFVFGGLYLAFGLLPAIISHVSYDLVLMALPLFVSNAPGSIWNKIIIVMCGLIPLWYVLYARYKKGSFHDLAGHWYNKAWQAITPQEPAATKEEYHEPVQAPAYRNIIVIAGILGFGAWMLFRHKTQDVQPLTLTRTQAIEKAHDAQRSYKLSIPSAMSELSNAAFKPSKKNIYVWRVGGKKAYDQLDGTYILSPHWKVRYAQFDGDIAKSAEEYVFDIYPNNAPVEFEHDLPKEQEGASLSKEEARTMALQFLETNYQLKPEDVVEVTAKEEKQPHRRDWKFVYRVKHIQDLGEGQARIGIHIGGDEIKEHERHVHIPEQWEREYEYETKIEHLIKNSSLILLVALLISLFMLIIRRRPVHPFALHAAVIIAVLLLLKTTIQAVNLWPQFVISFNTTSPYSRQVITILTSLLTTTLALTLFYAWLGGYVLGLLRGRCTKAQRTTFIQGISLACIVAGVSALATWIAPHTKPYYCEISNAGALLPWLSMGLKGFTSILNTSLITLLILHGFNMLSDYGRKNYGLLILAFLATGIAIAGTESISSLTLWAFTSMLIGLVLTGVYYLILRFNYCVIPVFVAAHTAIDALQAALVNAFPGVWAGAVLTILLSFAFAYWMMQQLSAYAKPCVQG